jgi:hypothetical protein
MCAKQHEGGKEGKIINTGKKKYLDTTILHLCAATPG